MTTDARNPRRRSPNRYDARLLKNFAAAGYIIEIFPDRVKITAPPPVAERSTDDVSQAA